MTQSKVDIKSQVSLLLVSVFIVAICGILYELLISTISSYFQGSSILHFSLVIGLFLSFMGLGSYLSRFIKKDLLNWFIWFELLLALVGGASTILLYAAFSLTDYYYGVMFSIIGVLGSLIGIEIPILTRIVREYDNLRNALANVLAFDYLGALIASLLFPLVLLPTLGTMRTAFVVGLLNLVVAIINIQIFRKALTSVSRLKLSSALIGMGLIAGFIYSFQLISFFEQFLYRDEIMYTKQSPYQRIVVTKWNEDIRLFIDGNLQFSTRDEYRYHEALVHIPMLASPYKEKVLILGGGDGMAAKEILKYPEVKEITLVDLDPAMTDLGQKHPVFVKLNQASMQSSKVKIINEDAFNFIERAQELYNVIIIDLPDPNNHSLGKLYSVEFYGLLRKCMAAQAVVVTQSTSPYFAPEAFWCINSSMREHFPTTFPYHTYVPTFGKWGFNIGVNKGRIEGLGGMGDADDSLRLGEISKRMLVEGISHSLEARGNLLRLRYLDETHLSSLFVFAQDTKLDSIPSNTIQNQRLVEYYQQSWERWR